MINKDTKKEVTSNQKGNICNDTFYTMWEPKAGHRFLVHMTHPKTKEYLMDRCLIKSIDRPGFTTYGGKKHWHTIKMRVYESIVPSHVLFRLLGAGRFNIQVDELGPVGDVIETWCIPNCRFKDVRATPLDWSQTGDVMIIQCELDWTEIVILRKDGSEFKIENKE